MRQRGFSLIEMIISLVVLALLGTVAGYGLTGGVKAFTDNADSVQTLGKLRYASERMVREVREVRRDVSDPASYDITLMTSSALHFSKVDGVEVRLEASPPLLTLAYSTPTGGWTLTDQVGSMAFGYFQLDGSAANSPSSVAFVEFNLELSRDGQLYPQRTRVALRNLQ